MIKEYILKQYQLVACGTSNNFLSIWLDKGVFKSWYQRYNSWFNPFPYTDIIMGSMASKINSFTIIYSNFYSSADQRKHQSSASLSIVRGIHRWPVNSPENWPVMRKMFPFDDVIMFVPLQFHKWLAWSHLSTLLYQICIIYCLGMTHRSVMTFLCQQQIWIELYYIQLLG